MSPYLTELARDYDLDFTDPTVIRKTIAETERSMAANDDPEAAQAAVEELRAMLMDIEGQPGLPIV